MICAPVARDLSSTATVLTNVLEFQRGRPATNLWTADILQRAVWRGSFVVVAGVNDKVNFNDGSARTATLNAGVYYTPALFAAELARAMNAVSTNWRCRWLQSAGTRYRFELYRTSGTASLQIATGAQASTNALRLLAGFYNADRAAAGTHDGDFACIHGCSAQLALDFVTARTMSGAILASIDGSAAALVQVQLGDANPATDETYCGSTFDGEGMLFPFTTGTARRYALVTISDPRREDAARTGLGALWMGTWFDTDRAGFHDPVEFESAFTYSLEQRAVVDPGMHGYPTIAEKRPGESFSLLWGTAPGVGPSQVPGFEQLFRDLGINGEAWLASTTGPMSRAPRRCRLMNMPVITRHPNTRSTIQTQWQAAA